jgi:hypothetical protein
MNTVDFKKHDIDIFINDTWQIYAGNFAFDQRESKGEPSQEPWIKWNTV